ncbi:MAG TPA: alpha/beta hydrolase domain-containing protein [Roseomonas sp.]
MRLALWPLLAAVLFCPGIARARITSIEILQTRLFAAGQDFGAGPYQVIRALAHGELDPADPHNAVIADIAIAPRNAQGRVEYATEVEILRPADPARASGRLVHEVTNRGRKLMLSYLQDATASQASMNGLDGPAAVGNALALRLGHTLVWNGWDPDVPRTGGNLTITMPVIEGVTAEIRDEFVFGVRLPADRATAPLSYPAADRDPAHATLTVRRARDDAPQPVAFDYADGQSIRLAGGARFTPLSIYEFRYPARGARPLGIGFAATRDLIAHLRHGGAGSPVADIPVRAVLAVGISQSGRYLRHHLGLGMNADEAGRRVFDGMLVHIAGAGRVFINERFAQPNRTATWHEDFAFPETWFPIALGTTRDPASGAEGALLRGDASDPLVIEVNTATEYWQKGASLTHTDPGGTRDLPELPGVRHFLVAGTKHAGRAGLTTARGTCVNLNNPHSSGPLLRALLVALDDWATRGVAPPDSRVPRIADGTLVEAGAVLAAFPAIRGAARPRFATPVAPVTDWVAGRRGDASGWRVLVPAVDADGNDRGGVTLPDLAVPLGTQTGWNIRAGEGLGGELCDREGSFFPFAPTRAARDAAGDPRPSLEERHGGDRRPEAAVRAAVAALVRDRLLLPEDGEAFVAAARR